MRTTIKIVEVAALYAVSAVIAVARHAVDGIALSGKRR